ncbi:MAG: hypothetical protein WCG87_11935 [Bacteroidota bacterium]
MYLNYKNNLATYNAATLSWELEKEVKRISLKIDLKGAIVKMIRNRAIDERIRRIQVAKSIAVWNTVNESATHISIRRVSAERRAIHRLERLKY